jgi:hypothetical protein
MPCIPLIVIPSELIGDPVSKTGFPLRITAGMTFENTF